MCFQPEKNSLLGIKIISDLKIPAKNKNISNYGRIKNHKRET